MAKKFDRFKPIPHYTSIKGLDKVTQIPRRGKIRLGVKATSGKGVEYPKDVDFFVVPPEVAAIYGDQPKELDVYLPHEDQSFFFPYALKRYQGSRLTCKGDGETATRINTETGEMTGRKCPCDYYGESCSERGSLMVILPDVHLSEAYQIDTGSIANIKSIQSSLHMIRALAERVSWIPLKLRRVPTHIQTPDGKTVTKALLKISLEGNEEDIAKFRKGNVIAIAGRALQADIKALPPVPDEEVEDVPGDAVLEEEVLTDSVPESHEDVPGAGQPDPPKGSPSEGGDRQASPPPQAEPPTGSEDPGPKLPPGKIRLIRALLTAKGIDDEKLVDDRINEWYSKPLSDVPASMFDDVKAKIATLPDREGPF